MDNLNREMGLISVRANIPELVRRALEKAPSNKTQEPPLAPAVCRVCSMPPAGHPAPWIMCELFAEIEQERDRLITAILAHLKALEESGLARSPDDWKLIEALPSWVSKNF